MTVNPPENHDEILLQKVRDMLREEYLLHPMVSPSPYQDVQKVLVEQLIATKVIDVEKPE